MPAPKAVPISELDKTMFRMLAEGGSVTLKEYYDIVHDLQEKLQTERDRRYSEVNVEREKALKIKEEADKAALGLAREIQTYKDEKANELREQISSERNLYVTKPELESTLRELKALRTAGEHWTWHQMATIVIIVVSVVAIYFKV